MSNATPQNKFQLPLPLKKGGSKVILIFFGLFWTVLFCLALIVAILQYRTVQIPNELKTRLLLWINAATDLPSIGFLEAEFGFFEGYHPKLLLEGTQLTDPKAGSTVELGQLEIAFDAFSMLKGDISLKSVRLVGAVLDIKRMGDGSFDLGFALFPDDSVPSSSSSSLDDVLEQTELFFQRPELKSLSLGQIDQLTVNYTDVLNGRVWMFDGGRFQASQIDGRLKLRADLALLTSGGDLATLGVSYENQSEKQSVLSAEIDNVSAKDLSLQSPALSWLGFADGAISGSLRSVRRDGKSETLHASLDFGRGVLDAGDGSAAIAYSEAKTYFSYLPEQERLNITTAYIKTDIGTLRADGYALLQTDNSDPNLSTGMVLHLNVEEANFTQVPWWRADIFVDQATAEMKIGYAPFTVSIGQIQARLNGQVIGLTGDIALHKSGWLMDVEAYSSVLSVANLQALWPIGRAEKGFVWFEKNVKGGIFRNFQIQAKKVENDFLQLTSSFQFENANVKFMRDMPEILSGSGYGLLRDNRFVMVSQAGKIQAEEGGAVAIEGSVFTIPDIRIPKPPVEFDLKGVGPLHAMMSLLNNKPFEFSKKAGRGVGDIQARANISAKVFSFLKKDVKLDDVDLRVYGTLTNVESDVLVPGKSLKAKTLNVLVSKDLLILSGSGKLSGVPFSGEWKQPRSELNLPGEIKINLIASEEALALLNIDLPKGLFKGKAPMNLVLNLVKDQPIKFFINSELKGIEISIPSLNWRKQSKALGSFQMAGKFTKPLTIEKFTLKAPDLATSGQILMGQAGIETVTLDRLDVGDWLSSNVVMRRRGEDLPMGIYLFGGSIDLRSLPNFESNDSSELKRSPVVAKFKSLRISDEIFLTDANAEMVADNSQSAKFSGQVNGGALIKGHLKKTNGVFVIDLQSKDGGGVLRDAGLLRQANGGSLSATLTSADGGWEGEMLIFDARVKDAPQIAEIISAISVIGLIEQIDGKGLLFSDIFARFNLKNRLFTLYEASAVGPSIGLSFDGYIDSKTNRMNIQGVLSPFFMLNSVGSFLTRRGEGLIGFNFNMRGSAKSPSVTVNPLSAFTPGMFRDIFRRPPPE